MLAAWRHWTAASEARRDSQGKVLESFFIDHEGLNARFPNFFQEKFTNDWPQRIELFVEIISGSLFRMSISGVIKNGQVVPEEMISLPEGTRVRIEPVPAMEPLTYAEIFRDFIGIFDDLPADLAEHHDHYAHGKPRSA